MGHGRGAWGGQRAVVRCHGISEDISDSYPRIGFFLELESSLQASGSPSGDPQTRSITWELIGMHILRPHPRPSKIRNPQGGGPANRVFKSPASEPICLSFSSSLVLPVIL